MCTIVKLSRDDITRLLIPNFQRPLDHRNVDKMVQHIYQRTMKGKYLIFGVLDIAEIQGPFGPLRYIVDGQHRFEAIKKFYLTTSIEINVYAMLYPCADMTEAQEIFQLRNLNAMVPDYLVTTNDKTSLLTEIQMYILTIPGFSSTKNKRPYINIPAFMNKLSDSVWFSTISNIDDFKSKIAYQNQTLANLLNNTGFIKSKRISDTMIANWQTWGNFLCVDSDFLWMNN